MKILPLIAMLFLSASAVAGVYKWTDETGRVHYSDKPPETAAEKLKIATQRTDPAQLTARLNQNEASPEIILADESERERLESEQQARRVQNCGLAKKAYDSLMSATRVYEPLPGGSRRYLEQDEIDKRKSDAQADVDKWCNKGK